MRAPNIASKSDVAPSRSRDHAAAFAGPSLACLSSAPALPVACPAAANRRPNGQFVHSPGRGAGTGSAGRRRGHKPKNLAVKELMATNRYSNLLGNVTRVLPRVPRALAFSCIPRVPRPLQRTSFRFVRVPSARPSSDDHLSLRVPRDRTPPSCVPSCYLQAPPLVPGVPTSCVPWISNPFTTCVL